MPTPPARRLLPLVLVATLALAACTSSIDATAVPAASATSSPAAEPTLTPVPGGQAVGPDVPPSGGGTTQAEWGEILLGLPGSFPIYPGAVPVDLPEVATAAFSVPIDSGDAVSWYRDALVEMGYRVEASDPLEGGEQVLDLFSDLPECRIQVVFRPEPDSTIISVLYGAGCAGIGG